MIHFRSIIDINLIYSGVLVFLINFLVRKVFTLNNIEDYREIVSNSKHGKSQNIAVIGSDTKCLEIAAALSLHHNILLVRPKHESVIAPTIWQFISKILQRDGIGIIDEDSIKSIKVSNSDKLEKIKIKYQSESDEQSFDADFAISVEPKVSEILNSMSNL